MKVKLTNKNLLSSFRNYFWKVTGASSLLLTFVDFEQECRFLIALICIVILISVFIYKWINANKKSTVSLNINGTNFNIFFGDIFKQNDNKIIPFNEYYDTIVNDRLIAKSTLNGIFLDNYIKNKNEINDCIGSNLRMKENEVKKMLLEKMEVKLLDIS